MSYQITRFRFHLTACLSIESHVEMNIGGLGLEL